SFLKLADRLVDLFRDHFFDPTTGTLGEFFTDEWVKAAGAEGTHVEPGHHYEWVWILREYERLSGRNVDPEKRVLYAFANQFGRQPGSGLIVDVLDRSGTVRDASTRIWPQTEAIKAHAVMADSGVSVASDQPLGEIIAQIVNNLLRRFFAREPP